MKEKTSPENNGKQHVYFYQGIDYSISSENDVRSGRELMVEKETEMGFNELITIIKKYIPTLNNQQVTTVKHVIYIGQDRGPAGPLEIILLINVRCSGLYTNEWEKIEGLYRLTIKLTQPITIKKIEKLTGTEIPF